MKDFVFLLTPWWGKALGAILGYLVAGPAGSVFGILIGNIFDIGLHNVLHTPQWHYYRNAPQEVKELFSASLFKTLGHIAKVDGRVTKQDINIARRIIREMRLFGIKKQRAMQYYNDGKNPYFKLENQLRLIKQLCYYNQDLLALFAETQHRAVKVNPISNIKKDKINLVFMLLGFKPMFPEQINTNNYYHQTDSNKEQSEQKTDSQHKYYYSQREQSNKTLTDYEILGIKQGERSAVVKMAYRKMMSKIHPDKLIAKGASEAEIDQATDQAQQVQAAYERIKKSREF